MMNGYAETGLADTEAVFDLFFRAQPGLDFAVAAGLEQAVEYIENLHFDEDDVDYLRSLNCFGEKFFARLKNFAFTGDVFAMREGEMVFPHEPLLTVRAPVGRNGAFEHRQSSDADRDKSDAHG